MHEVYLGIGSNLGNRRRNIEQAIELLNLHGFLVKDVSPIFEYEPYGFKEQPRFLNAVLKGWWDGTPQELLNVLKKIEKKIGRKKRRRWGPREIDLDILFFDSIIYETEELKIPHPDLHNRVFVLEPLSTIAPKLVHPVFKKTIKELLDNIREKI